MEPEGASQMRCNLSGTAGNEFSARLKEIKVFGTTFLFSQRKSKGEITMEETMTGLDFKMSEVAARIRELRQIDGISVETMAKLTGVSREEYAACEAGTHDLSFAFIYRCALAKWGKACLRH